MRRLGDVLGVKAMALYNHFADKEAILDAVASLALARLPAPPTKGQWKSRIKTICHSVRQMALEYPRLFRVAMTRPTPPGSALPLIEASLTALAEAGLSPAAQAVAHHTLRLYVRAYCLWEIEELNDDADPAEQMRLPSAYPRTAAVANYLSSPDRDRQFDAGLELILRGLPLSRER